MAIYLDKRLLEKLSLEGIARVAEVSEGWLQAYVNGKYKSFPRHVDVDAKKKATTLECDELWSFVGHKGNKQWVWLVLQL